MGENDTPEPVDAGVSPAAVESRGGVREMKAQALENLQRKVRDGKNLTAAEWKQLERATVARKAPGISPLAARYGEKNVSRMNALVKAGAPPVPWEDPSAVAVWYQTHYAKKRRVLPSWILKEIGKPTALPAPPPPPPSVMIPGDFEKIPAPPLSVVDASSAGESPVDFFERNLRELQRRIDEVREATTDPAGMMTMLRTYEGMLKTWQDAKARELREDSSSFLSKEAVCQAIDAIHARLPRRLAGELKNARAAAARASGEASAWFAFCEEFFASAMRSVVETKFADVVAPAGEAA